MTFFDLILALYPLYLSIDAIKNPTVVGLKHCVTFWILWFELSFVTSIINFFFWWVPFTSLLDTLKLLVLILSYKPRLANLVCLMFHKPLWDNIYSHFPPIFRKVIHIISSYYPIIHFYRTKILTFLRDFSAIINVSDNNNKTHPIFIDTSISNSTKYNHSQYNNSKYNNSKNIFIEQNNSDNHTTYSKHNYQDAGQSSTSPESENSSKSKIKPLTPIKFNVLKNNN